MKRVKLANVLFGVEDFFADDVELIYKASSPAAFDAETGVFTFSREVDFTTFFNSFSSAKWRRYTEISTARLHVELSGDACKVITKGSSANGERFSTSVGKVKVSEAGDDFGVIEIDVPFAHVDVAGFELLSEGTSRVRNAYYYTLVDERAIRDIDIAIATTTFKKEEYIIPNIERVKREVLSCDDPVADHLHMFVVDNGRTLDADALNDEGVTILPNDNTGGAGGFARGMMAALDSETPFTHVILMDDDVRMSTESFKRVFALLSLACSTYSKAFINGAMLEVANPSNWFEDVSYVRSTGGYESLKPPMRMDRLENLIRCETIDVEVPNAYGAWWFSCIPTETIREMGLPMPFFVRCDDVEYGVRCQATYMTMNGICVWHEAFNGRFRASVDCYQYARNMLATIAVDRCSREQVFMLRFWRVFRIYLRTMNYNAAELWLDGLEDYLKGPKFLMKANGSALMKMNGSKNEPLEPLDELDQEVIAELSLKPEWLEAGDKRSNVMKVLESIPHDRHYLPDWLLRSKPGLVTPQVSGSPWLTTACKKTLVAVDPSGKTGHVRTMDRERHKQLVERGHDLKMRYRNNHLAVEESFQDKFRTMTSREFWREYLNLSDGEQ